MKEGFISLHRSIMSTPYYRNSEKVHTWIHLLMKANFVNNIIEVDGNDIEIKRGQFLTSINTLERELKGRNKLNKAKIYRILKYFKKAKQIEMQTTSKYTIITIVNYDKYQINEMMSAKQLNYNKKAIELLMKTNNKDNNGNNEIINNKTEIFDYNWLEDDE